MRFVLMALLACLPVVSSCGSNTSDNTASSTDIVADTSPMMDSTTSTGANPQAKINEIDGGMATLQAHQAEDPAKMDRLISECQTETGAVMEGEGAMRIVSCVNSKW